MTPLSSCSFLVFSSVSDLGLAAAASLGFCGICTLTFLGCVGGGGGAAPGGAGGLGGRCCGSALDFPAGWCGVPAADGGGGGEAKGVPPAPPAGFLVNSPMCLPHLH